MAAARHLEFLIFNQSINRILFQTANVHRNIIMIMIIIIIVIMVKLDIREEKKKRNCKTQCTRYTVT